MRRVPLSVEPPAFPGVGLSQDVYLNSITPLSVIGSGGGSNYPADANFSTISLCTGGFIQTPSGTNAGGNGITNGYCGIVQNLVKDNVLGGQDCIAVVRSDAGTNKLFPFATSFLVVGNSGTGTEGANQTGNISWDTLSSRLIITPASISSLNVSSINGATPGTGGTVPPDLTLSTLTVEAITVSTITSPSGITTIIGSLNMTGGNISNTNTIYGTSAELTQLYIDSINPKTLAAESITIRGLDPVTQANNYLSTLNIDSAQVSISNNLNVSSINNTPALTLAQYQYLSSITPP